MCAARRLFSVPRSRDSPVVYLRVDAIEWESRTNFLMGRLFKLFLQKLEDCYGWAVAWVANFLTE